MSVSRKAPFRYLPYRVNDFVGDKVASYKQIRKLTFIDAIPKSPSGKILRRVLRDQAAG